MIGHTIVDVEMLSDKDMESEGWDSNERSAVLILDDGTRLYASCDYEGNGPGAIFGRKDDKHFAISVQEGT